MTENQVIKLADLFTKPSPMPGCQGDTEVYLSQSVDGLPKQWTGLILSDTALTIGPHSAVSQNPHEAELRQFYLVMSDKLSGLRASKELILNHVPIFE